MKLLSILTLSTLVTYAAGGLLPFWSDGEKRIIKTGPENYEIVDELTKLNYRRQNIKFMDVTNQLRRNGVNVADAVAAGSILGPDNSLFQQLQLLGSKQLSTLKSEVPVYRYPKKAKHTEAVEKLASKIDIENVHSNLAQFTSFHSRYYKSSWGFESATWLLNYITKLTEPVASKVEIESVKHEGWDQFSIVVRIPGKVEDKVIVGAHQDSANLLFPNVMRAPGADDDGSGTVTTLEVLRLLVGAIADGDFTPHNTLEFHYYSAEEGGLLGSVDVFSNYYEQNVTVIGMLQQDMTGYTAGTIDAGEEPHFGLIEDYVSPQLNEFIKLIITQYCAIPYHETKCGYACSDHASALENGYPSSFLIESEMKYTSKYIHSVMDTIDRLDFDHIKEHIKLTIGYAYELSQAKL